MRALSLCDELWMPRLGENHGPRSGRPVRTPELSEYGRCGRCHQRPCFWAYEA
jgi:hypothetical protein